MCSPTIIPYNQSFTGKRKAATPSERIESLKELLTYSLTEKARENIMKKIESLKKQVKG